MPAKIPEPIQQRIELPYVATVADIILVGIETLLRHAYANPRMRGRRAAVATAYGLADAATDWERTFHFKNPTGDAQVVFENIRARLPSDPPAPSAPLDELEIILTEINAESGYQIDMLDAKRTGKRRRLADAARYMRLRSIAEPIVKVSEFAPWRPLPEMRVVKTPLDASAAATLQPLNAPEPDIVRATLAGTPAAARTQGKRRMAAHRQFMGSRPMVAAPTSAPQILRRPR